MQTCANSIILYDGVCGFCNRVVQFILKRDVKDHFRFAALQGEFASNLLRKHGLDSEKLESVNLVLNFGQPTESLQVSSTAAITIGRQLGLFWKILANILSMAPKPIRDFGYNLVARYRYRIFGKYKTCPLPASDVRHKFIDFD